MQTKTAEEWAVNLVEIMQEYDGPAILHSDNGGEFKNSLFLAIANSCGIKLKYGGPYRPQVQGADEKFNDTLKRILGKLMIQQKTKRWIDLLSIAVRSYRLTKHSTTKLMPFQVYFGRRPVRSLQLAFKPDQLENEDNSIKDILTPELDTEVAILMEALNTQRIKVVQLCKENLNLNADRMQSKSIRKGTGMISIITIDTQHDYIQQRHFQLET